MPLFEKQSADDAVLNCLKSNPSPHRIEMWDRAIRQHFTRIDSTQAQAATLVDVLPHDRWIIISADEQTVGHGTHNRPWTSPPHVNIYATFIVPFPKKASDKVFYISQVTAIAVSRSVKKYGVQPQIKWPNDLLLNGKKLGGILSENKTPTVLSNYTSLLIGVGLNVNMGKDICNTLDQPVTSLMIETGHSFDTELILTSLYQNLRACVQQLLDEGFSSFHEELHSMLACLGTHIIVDRDGADFLEGVFVGVDDMGRMRLRCDNGKESILMHGRIRKKID